MHVSYAALFIFYENHSCCHIPMVFLVLEHQAQKILAFVRTQIKLNLDITLHLIHSLRFENN
jgi:hypothetical protein